MIGYIARDRNGYLYFYATKPKKDLELGVWAIDSLSFFSLDINKKEFSKIKWEDEHPTKVEIKIKKNN